MKLFTIFASVMVFSQLSFASNSLPEPGITLPGYWVPSYCFAVSSDSTFQLSQEVPGSLTSPETKETYRVDGGSQSEGVLSLDGVVENAQLGHTAHVTWTMDLEDAGTNEFGERMYQGELNKRSVGFGLNRTESFEIYCQ